MLLGRNRLLTLYALLATIWLSLFHLGRLYTYYDPSSFFYDPQKAYETRYTDLREEEANHFLDIINHASADKLSNVNYTINDIDLRDQDKRICIGIPSVRREREQFLPRTLASLVDGLDARERRLIRIIVLLADDDPTTHPAFNQRWLHRLADEVLLYSNTSIPAVPDVYRYVQPFTSKGNDTRLRNDRVHRDYATLMADCRETGAQYFVLMEDDVIAARHWLGRLLDGLVYLEQIDNAEKWLYLRLFYSETYLGWNSEQWPDYLVRSLCFYTMVLFLYLVAVVDMRQRSHTFRFKVHSYNVLHLTLWTASFIVLYFLTGRLTVDPYREGIREMPNYGCCAQGLVIPPQHLLALENALHAASDDIAGDSLIEKFADDRALRKYAIVPSLLQHVGIKGSSDAQGRKKATWNFNFEKIVS
ncbi:alpha- -mannosyl-glycoprotein 4-beta-n-acetylglucosaminyltransferase c [Fusarium langsethiae]|uniref:Alpha--mannosyl-glycoprotein 4-beta-n-acetylglucosaminyltransferase c n=1 Tax=Fusarium langsethiae TaxID=179993 RepID=A0A0M9F4K9_FUSLA|nr:alpha- -mannosyl-glycoprotein 4-beta-n-acetylglucosaminyltransferase c [Fusarium langsethiae]